MVTCEAIAPRAEPVAADEASKTSRCDPIFLVGAGSSGNTLLGVMLDRHSQIACGPELFVFDKQEVYGRFETFRNKLAEWIARGLMNNGQSGAKLFFRGLEAYFCDEQMLGDWADRAGSTRAFFDLFFAHYLEKRGKRIWAEKTGSNGYRMDEILRLYPGARIIHVVRDGRDAVCSLLGRSPSPYHCVSHWLYNVSAALAWRGHPNYLEVKYERLVSDPESSLERICRHVGVAFEPTMLEPSDDGYWQALARDNIHASWKLSPFDARISTASIGRYRKNLPADVLALFWRMKLSPIARRRLGVRYRGARDLMALLGYAASPGRERRGLSLRVVRSGLGEYGKRLRSHWRVDRRVWLPLTFVGR